MDRRKLKSRTNVLHQQLYSASQTVTKTVVDESTKENCIARSVTDVENLPVSRKRKNSESEEEDEIDVNKMSSLTKNANKKRRNVIDDDNDSDEEPISPKRVSPSKRPGKKDKDKTFAKPTARNKSNTSDNEDENDQATSSGNSIRGFLESLDKSPSKLSQSSNSSVDKYRRMNLRTPISSKLQKPVSKAIAEKKKEEASKIKKPQLNDPRLKKSQLKSVPGPASSKKDVSQIIVETDNSTSEEEEISFSDSDDPPAKKTAKNTAATKNTVSTKNKTPLKLGNKNSKPKNTPDKTEDSPTKKLRSPEKTHTSPNKNLRTPDRPNTSPAKNLRSREVESPELSPLKSFQSPEKVNVNTRRKKTKNQSDNKFIDFLNTVGISLGDGDNLHIANADPREVTQKMKELLTSDSVDIDEILRSWKAYIDDEENLRKSLLEMKIETDEGTAICSKAVSLSRLLLQVPQLQDEILSSLFKKLIDAVFTTDSSDDAPWALQMLQQFRFLEIIVDPDLLITRIEELLSSSPEWFQREVIVFIPDIVTDTHHRTTAEMLIKIMENNGDLTNIILDCIHNLILGKDYREELREKILELLEKKPDKSTVPAITKFILTACATEAVALKSLNALRLVDMSPSSKERIDECYTNQTFMVNAIKMSIQLFKEVMQAAVSIIKTTSSEAVPLDIILSIILYETTTAKKKIVEATLYNHIKDGYYKTNLISIFYTGYKQVARSFQSTALNLAIHLLKADSPAHIEFGIEWLRNIFVSQSDTSYKQREIMEKLLNLMGNKDKTVKNALEVLCRMANDEKERHYLQQHAGFLRIFLEKIDNLQFDEVATLYHILHGLCTQSELIANILNDDLAIIMQKQLCSSKVLTKCKGVLGAVMAIKHLAGNDETIDQAYQLLKKTLSSLKGCLRSQALFYDQLGQIIATTSEIDEKFLSDILTYFEEDFINNCLVDSNPSDSLQPKFGLNDLSTMEESYYVYFGNGKSGTFVPVFFKLLRICNLRLTGSLESINAVLGCPVLMPEDMDMPETSTADYMIHCINWFRELVGGFVTQNETLLQEQVLKRLESLMSLQGEFVTMVAMLESRYQPPPCYFHHFPMPQFVRIDMKVGKKAGRKGKKKGKKDKEEEKSDLSLNKSVILPEWESWELGSELTIKNPAYFRQMDTKIIHLLDANMEIHSSQANSENITIAQVCFIVKELLGMFENQASESFVRDLIHLLPKICAKLQKIIIDLRQNDSAHEKEAVRLFLCLLITIFSWKEFESARYDSLLRDGLRTLAGMMNESSALLRSCKDLVSEAYKYFESLADIATQISLAVSLVNMCNCLMNRSKSFKEQSKDRQAKMAYGFLCLEWSGEPHGAQYRAAIKELLKTWIDNEPDPLKTITSVLEWLPQEAASLERPQSRLGRLPSVTKANFHLLLKQLFTGLVKGLEISLDTAERDPDRIGVWLDTAHCLDKISNICKANKNNAYLILFLRYTTILYQALLNSGMKLLEANIKYQTDDVLNVIKIFQRSGRFLRDIFCTARKEKIVALLKLIPFAKSRREKFIYRVKGMLTANNSIGAFWMGNLLNKDLDGEEIANESSEEATATTSEVTSENNVTDEAGSEIFDSDSDEDMDVDVE